MPEVYMWFGPNFPLFESTTASKMTFKADHLVERTRYNVAMIVPDLKERSVIPIEEVDMRPAVRPSHWSAKGPDIEVEIVALWSEEREREADNVAKYVEDALLQVLPPGATLYVSVKVPRGAGRFSKKP